MQVESKTDRLRPSKNWRSDPSAARRLVTSCSRTCFYLDTAALDDMHIPDRSPWQVNSSSHQLYDDFMIEPLGLNADQRIEYVPLPASKVGTLVDKHVLLVGGGENGVIAMETVAREAGAIVESVGLSADVKAIEGLMEGRDALDAVFVGAGPVAASGTLDTDAAAWERLFDLHCKAPYYVAAKALPLLRLSAHAHVVMVAPAPACHPQSLALPAVPCAVISQIRGLYVVGMAVEFDGTVGDLGVVRFNAIWEGTAASGQGQGGGVRRHPPRLRLHAQAYQRAGAEAAQEGETHAHPG